MAGPTTKNSSAYAMTTDPRVAKVLAWFEDSLRNCPVTGWTEIKTVGKGGGIVVEISWSYKFTEKQDGG